MEITQGAGITAVFVGEPILGVVIERRRAKKADRMLRNWAATNCVEILTCRRCWIPPFRLWLVVSPHHVLFGVRVAANVRFATDWRFAKASSHATFLY